MSANRTTPTSGNRTTPTYTFGGSYAVRHREYEPGEQRASRLDAPPTYKGPREDEVFPTCVSAIIDYESRPRGRECWKAYIKPQIATTRESQLFPGYLERAPRFEWNSLWYIRDYWHRHIEPTADFDGLYNNLTPSQFTKLNNRRIWNERHRQLRDLRNNWVFKK